MQPSAEFDLIVDWQVQLEDEALRRVPRPLLIRDTDVLATAIWHKRYVGPDTARIFERAAAHPPALYVLTGDEIPFVQDGMRDGEQIRHGMHTRFREVLEGQRGAVDRCAGECGRADRDRHRSHSNSALTEY